MLNVVAWSAQAACRETDPDEMFVQGAAQNRVKQICNGCPVTALRPTSGNASILEW